MDGTIGDSPLHEMDDAILLAIGRMGAQCIEQGLDMSNQATADLIRELCDRLEARDG